MVTQRKLIKVTPILQPTTCIVIYTEETLIKNKPRTAIELQETYHTFAEFQKVLLFLVVLLMNQMMTLNIVDTTERIITITIPDTNFYVTYNPFADMVLHLNTKNFD